MKRAIYYARVSTDEEKQLNALKKQIQENKDTIYENGWELVGEYIDEGKSGTQTKTRTSYNKLINDMEQNKFDIIVVKDQDRLQRNTKDWYIFVDRLVTNHIQLYFYLDHKYFNSGEDALITGIKAILAEEFSRNLSKKLNNTNKRRLERAKAGEEVSAMGARALGYRIVNKKWETIPEEIELCKKIWDKYEEFGSLRKVTHWLNSHGYKNIAGGDFYSSTVSRILQNPKAKGIISIGKYHRDFDTKQIVKQDNELLVEMPELAYVSAERFDKVQDMLKKRTSQNNRGVRVSSSPFYQKLYCEKCGGKLSRQCTKHGDKNYETWRCSKIMQTGTCIGTTISGRRLMEVYTALAENLTVNREVVKDTITAWLKDLKNKLATQDNNTNTIEELKKAQKQRDRLTDIYLDGIISKDDYRAKYEVIEGKIKDLESEINHIDENEDIKSIEYVLKNIDTEIDNYINAEDFNENKINFLVEHTNKITVRGNKHLIIELDLIAGAIIAGKDFSVFVNSSEQYQLQIQNIVVEIKIIL